MGKHVRRLWHLPPGAKPRHRFVIALGTIVLLAFGAMAIVAAIYPENGPLASASPDPDGQMPNPFGDLPPATPAQPDESNTGTPTGVLAAAYAVPTNAIWGTGFQVQIAMTNTTPSAQAWQIKLRYPQNVTNVSGTWVDGQPQPLMLVGELEYTFNGAAPVQPGETVVFKVQFDKVPQSDVTLRECSANGRPCQVE